MDAVVVVVGVVVGAGRGRRLDAWVVDDVGSIEYVCI